MASKIYTKNSPTQNSLERKYIGDLIKIFGDDSNKSKFDARGN
jgi:hypothetical protein